MCYRCFRPAAVCLCPVTAPMPTRTRFVFLMHPREFKDVKANTGRLTHLHLASSELHVGVDFEEHPAVRAILRDPSCFPVLLYPGAEARDLSQGGLPAAEPGPRRLVVFLLDATWSGARKMLRLNPTLGRLPRVVFTPSAPSRYVIKQQPQVGCLSTLEAVHETLLALERAGLDDYPEPGRLLEVFAKMQDVQIRCAADPARRNHNRPAGASRGLRVVRAVAEPSRRRRYLRGAAPPREVR